MDDAEARAILAEHDIEVPKRGRLAPQWHTRAESLRADAPPAEPGEPTEADFAPEGDDVSVAAQPPELPAERRPRRPTRERKSLRQRVTDAKAKPGAKKKPKPRVSVAPLISTAWAAMGGIVRQVDGPVGITLQIQAPVAGPVLEDVVKGTFFDRALQPVARAGDKAEKILALAGAPMCVAGLELAQRLPEPQRKAREAILYPLLIESLVLGERVAGQYADVILERAQKDGDARERAARTAAAIFGQVPEKEPAAA